MSFELDRSIRKAVPRHCKNPVEVVNRLTSGKTKDFEKFKSIFSWVLLNRTGKRSGDFTPTSLEIGSISEILRKNNNSPENICRLMDTLCSIAGLSNYSIRGYVKDILFDVNDSLYLGNHIWNAVKLEGQWYLYDLNWCKGNYVLITKPFSVFVLKCINYLDARKKIREVKVRSKLKSNFCEKAPPTISFTVATQGRLNRILLTQLLKIKIKSSWQFENKINPRYYLSSPAYFAQSHFPVQNYWSLLESTKNIHWFESDSSFYYLYWPSKDLPEIGGSACIACDDNLLAEPQKKYKALIVENKICNARNTAINWYAKAKLGIDLFKQAQAIQDSLGKVTMLDSALKTYADARIDVYKTNMDVYSDWQEHVQKNVIKGNLHYESTQWCNTAVSAIITDNKNRTRAFRTFSLLFSRYGYTFKRQLYKNYALSADSGIAVHRRVSQQVLDMYSSLAYETNRKASAIDSNLSFSMVQYNMLLNRLSQNLWSKHTVLAEISEQLSEKAIITQLALLDHYKKDIRDIDQEIRATIGLNFDMLYSDIYSLSDSTVSLGTFILKQMEERNRCYLITGKLLRSLRKQGEIHNDSLKHYLKLTGIKIKEEACKLFEESAAQQAVLEGYELFFRVEKNLERTIRFNRNAERYRRKEINAIINYRHRQYRSVPKTNLVSTRRLELQVIRYKKAYLRSLKQERKEQRKQMREK